jgi:signal transduction histidine kinase
MNIEHSQQLLRAKVLGGIAVVCFFASVAILHPVASALFGVATLAIALYLAVGMVGSLRREMSADANIADLTNRLRETEWKLVISNEQIQVLDQRKSEFVSVVSHQLRAPVTAINGYSSMMLEEAYGKLPETMREPMNKIFLSSKRVSELVTDFLDLTKIEAGTLMYNFSSVDIAAMLHELAEEYAPIAKGKGIAFEVEMLEKEACVATADAEKMRQIISNLIDNAIKYTSAGSVKVTLEKNRAAGLIRLSVKDTGMGIGPDDMQNLFQKFSRGPSGPKLFTEGSGLGLYVAKKMLEQHKGGKILAHSDGLGKGATFFLELLAEEK